MRFCSCKHFIDILLKPTDEISHVVKELLNIFFFPPFLHEVNIDFIEELNELSNQPKMVCPLRTTSAR